MRNERAAVPLLLFIHTLLLVTPAVMCGGAESITRGAIPWGLGVLSFIFLAEVAAQPRDRNVMPSVGLEHRLASGSNVVQGAFLLGAFQLFFVSALDQTPGMAARYGGGFILAVGCVLRFTAIRSLGHGFTDGFSPLTRSAISSGPYRFLHHPAETGLLMLPVGLAIMLGTWPMLPIAMPPLLFCAVARIWTEERCLARSRTMADALRRP